MKAESCYELVNLDLTIVSLKYVNIISVFAFFVQFNFKKDNDLNNNYFFNYGNIS